MGATCRALHHDPPDYQQEKPLAVTSQVPHGGNFSLFCPRRGMSFVDAVTGGLPARLVCF